MKTVALTKRIVVALALWTCLVTLLGCLAILPASADAGRVHDPADMLTATEEATLTAHMDALSAQYGVELYMATYDADHLFDDEWGDEYCRKVQNLYGRDAVLLIVTYDRLDHMYYYDMYTYGTASLRIRQSEVNYILDRGDVYRNIKSGRVAAGTTAFFDASVLAFEGRMGISWWIIIAVSAVIALIIALAVCGGVKASYSKKRAKVDYPLDDYATLELTHERDAFVREYVTRAYVPRSGGGGGGSRHGGGGGHRGGR